MGGGSVLPLSVADTGEYFVVEESGCVSPLRRATPDLGAHGPPTPEGEGAHSPTPPPFTMMQKKKKHRMTVSASFKYNN